MNNRAVLRSSTPANNLQYRLVLLGASSVGKSCLVNYYVKGQFPESQKETVCGMYL